MGMFKYLPLFLLLFFYQANAQSLEPSSFKGILIEHDYYSISYVETYEQPEWTFHVICQDCYGEAKRKNNFRQDLKVVSGSSQLVDYKGSGYDRGHLVPAADMNRNEIAMSESFFLSNMSPQKPSFNRGVWRKLETAIRNLSLEYDTIFVITGPVVGDNPARIGPNKVIVPKSYFKVLYLPQINKMIGYLLNNEASSLALKSFQLTVDEIESISGIDMFPALEDKLENRLESELYDILTANENN